MNFNDISRDKFTFIKIENFNLFSDHFLSERTLFLYYYITYTRILSF